MAIGVVFDFVGANEQQYDQVCRRLNNGMLLTSLSEWPIDGCLAHAAGTGPTGDLRVVDVWESPEAFQAFGQQLMPLLQEAGIQPVEPQVFPLHNFVK